MTICVLSSSRGQGLKLQMRTSRRQIDSNEHGRMLNNNRLFGHGQGQLLHSQHFHARRKQAANAVAVIAASRSRRRGPDDRAHASGARHAAAACLDDEAVARASDDKGDAALLSMTKTSRVRLMIKSPLLLAMMNSLPVIALTRSLHHLAMTNIPLYRDSSQSMAVRPPVLIYSESF
jgi:hypothetical protein